MKHIYLNLKRFDVPTEFGGVNRIAPVAEWAEYIVKNTQDELKKYDRSEVEFAMYFPEVHLLNAAKAKTEDSPIKVGCQSRHCSRWQFWCIYNKQTGICNGCGRM